MPIDSLLLGNVGKVIPEMEKQDLAIRMIRIRTIELWVRHWETVFVSFAKLCSFRIKDAVTLESE